MACMSIVMRVRVFPVQTRLSDGSRMPISARMIPITTSISTSVKARRRKGPRPRPPWRAPHVLLTEEDVIFSPKNVVRAGAEQDVGVLPAGSHVRRRRGRGERDAGIPQVLVPGLVIRCQCVRRVDSPEDEVAGEVVHAVLVVGRGVFARVRAEECGA